MASLRLTTLALMAALFILVGCSDESNPGRTQLVAATQTEPKWDEIPELNWDALIPSDWQPEKIREQYDASGLSDEDPRAQALMEKLQAAWREAPVVREVDGRLVKMRGFVVPLETDGERISQFLLVPFFGACIHSPPPPANQTVLVVTENGHEYEGGLFGIVWVTGMIKVQSATSDLAAAGYQFPSARVVPFKAKGKG